MSLVLKLTYPLLAHLRDVLRKQKLTIWQEEYLWRIGRSAPNELVLEGYTRVIDDNRNPMLPQGRCNLILDQIDHLEEVCQWAIKGVLFYCEECATDAGIVAEHKVENFMYIPVWRRLSCGHIVGIQGKVWTQWDILFTWAEDLVPIPKEEAICTA